jgi:hypothetical protein
MRRAAVGLLAVAGCTEVGAGSASLRLDPSSEVLNGRAIAYRAGSGSADALPLRPGERAVFAELSGREGLVYVEMEIEPEGGPPDVRYRERQRGQTVFEGRADRGRISFDGHRELSFTFHVRDGHGESRRIEDGRIVFEDGDETGGCGGLPPDRAYEVVWPTARPPTLDLAVAPPSTVPAPAPGRGPTPAPRLDSGLDRVEWGVLAEGCVGASDGGGCAGDDGGGCSGDDGGGCSGESEDGGCSGTDGGGCSNDGCEGAAVPPVAARAVVGRSIDRWGPCLAAGWFNRRWRRRRPSSR